MSLFNRMISKIESEEKEKMSDLSHARAREKRASTLSFNNSDDLDISYNLSSDKSDKKLIPGNCEKCQQALNGNEKVLGCGASIPHIF